MSSLVIRQLPLLELLTKVDSESRRKILEYGKLDLIKAIVECVYNVLKNNVQMRPERVDELKNYKKTLRQIVKSGKKKYQKEETIYFAKWRTFFTNFINSNCVLFIRKTK